MHRHEGRNGLCTAIIDATCGTPAERRKAPQIALSWLQYPRSCQDGTYEWFRTV